MRIIIYPVHIHNSVTLHGFYHHVLCCWDFFWQSPETPEEDRWDDQDHSRSCWWPRSKFNSDHDRLGLSTDLKMTCWMQIQGSFRTWRAKCWHLIGCTRETWQKYWTYEYGRFRWKQGHASMHYEAYLSRAQNDTNKLWGCKMPALLHDLKILGHHQNIQSRFHY